MRRMVAPGVWQDMGPGAAVTSSSRARMESGRLIGQMVPEKSAGPNPLLQQRAATSPSIKAHAERRKAARAAARSTFNP